MSSDPQRSSPGAELSRAATSFLEAGWQIRRLDLDDKRTDAFEIGIVLALGERAKRLSLTLSSDGTPVSFRQTDVPLPEARIYRNRARLTEAFAAGPVAGIDVGCDEYLLVIAQVGEPIAVTFEPDDYYIPVEAVRGKRAGQRAARALIDAADSGLFLVRMAHRDREIDLVFGSLDEELAVHLATDPTGAVDAYELRVSPPRPIGERYEPSAQAELVSAVRANPEFATVAARPNRIGPGGGVEIGLRGGRRVFLAWNTFVDVEGKYEVEHR
jgi:hypothetical protein